MNTEAIAAFDLLSRMRFACGDNGKRMQDELEEYLRELKCDAERYRWRKENPAIEVEVFRGRYRCTARDSVVTDWLDSYDDAIDAAMNGANTGIKGSREAASP